MVASGTLTSRARASAGPAALLALLLDVMAGILLPSAESCHMSPAMTSAKMSSKSSSASAAWASTFLLAPLPLVLPFLLLFFGILSGMRAP
jgi:hypothetical protein